MKVAAIQHDIVWEDRDVNFARLAPQIAAAAGAGARIALLAEMFSTGFSLDVDRIAEREGGPSEEFLRGQAVAHGLWVGGSAPVLHEDDDRPRNTFLLAGPDGELHRYDKIHPFSYAREDEHYQAGSDLVTVEIEGVRVSLFVCYDLRFADENQAYVVGVNRVGEGDGLVYSGDSAIIDPLGERIATGSRTEALLVAEIDAQVVSDVRTRFPFLRDRR